MFLDGRLKERIYLWGVYIFDPRAKLAGIEPQRNFGRHVGAWITNLEVPQNSHLNLEVFFYGDRAIFVKKIGSHTELELMKVIKKLVRNIYILYATLK